MFSGTVVGMYAQTAQKYIDMYFYACSGCLEKVIFAKRKYQLKE